MKAKLVSNSKQIVSYVKTHNYNFSHSKLAKNALKTIESIKGKTNPKLIETCNTYAADVLGWKGYAPWLKAYSAMLGTFKEGWIPENYFGSVVVPKLQGEVGKTSFLKPLSKKIFNSPDFPDVGHFVNGSFFTENYQYLTDNNIILYLFKDTNKVVFKLNNSAQGVGIFVFEKDTFDVQQIKRLGEGVFQKYIKQHVFFNSIMPNSVSTIRIVTVLDNSGNASVRAAYLRVGRSNDSHVQSNSQISIPIDLKTGALNALGHSKSWYTMDTHPDTGFVFKNKVIPNFKSVLNKALKLQNDMAMVKCIGWDMVLDEDNKVQIMEWNGFHTGIGFAEFTQGPCFKDLGWEHLWK
ncbi:sugar-transfer associated ATP-grasp domain-containing protein [Hyunsoonleella sp. 2307UL5-6]|uniref:sugar-transfer associated ATP-grasp domain-containing protein n=1 Tax=Hyunsoonleella sp. 2307UL5-6 TaxID=3384768 RepID=UPI0039BCC74A